MKRVRTILLLLFPLSALVSGCFLGEETDRFTFYFEPTEMSATTYSISGSTYHFPSPVTLTFGDSSAVIEENVMTTVQSALQPVLPFRLDWDGGSFEDSLSFFYPVVPVLSFGETVLPPDLQTEITYHDSLSLTIDFTGIGNSRSISVAPRMGTASYEYYIIKFSSSTGGPQMQRNLPETIGEMPLDDFVIGKTYQLQIHRGYYYLNRYKFKIYDEPSELEIDLEGSVPVFSTEVTFLRP